MVAWTGAESKAGVSFGAESKAGVSERNSASDAVCLVQHQSSVRSRAGIHDPPVWNVLLQSKVRLFYYYLIACIPQLSRTNITSNLRMRTFRERVKIVLEDSMP